MSNHPVTSRAIGGHAPLDREMLDSAASPLRVIGGIIFLGWSWVSTVLIIGKVLAPAFVVEGEPAAPVPTSYLIGFGVALLVTVVEFVSAGRWPKVYAAVLVLFDAPFTTYQTVQWLTAIISALTIITPAGEIGIWIASFIGGIVAAIFGELLLFGRRR